MSAQNVSRKYDRDFLLSPEKRNQIVELWEVEKYGRDCFNDPNHVHLTACRPMSGMGAVSAFWLALVSRPSKTHWEMRSGGMLQRSSRGRPRTVLSAWLIRSQARATASTRSYGIYPAQRASVLRSSPPSSI